MNERIKELAEQCYDPEHGFIIPEKFAELIVRECADIAFTKYATTNGAESGESAILKHFGVEE